MDDGLTGEACTSCEFPVERFVRRSKGHVDIEVRCANCGQVRRC